MFSNDSTEDLGNDLATWKLAWACSQILSGFIKQGCYKLCVPHLLAGWMGRGGS